MKKVISITTVLVFSLGVTHASLMGDTTTMGSMDNMSDTMEGMDNMGDDITNSVMGSMTDIENSMDNLDASMDQLDVNMEKMMAGFDSWEDNFDDMMNNFETKLEDSLDIMGKRIDSMMDGMMDDLDKNMDAMQVELDKTSEKLSDNIVNVLDTKLDKYFLKIKNKTSGDKEYIEKITKLTDKVDNLEKSGKIKSDLLKNAVNYIGKKADVNKQEVVTDNVINIKNKDVEDISKDDLEEVKGLFDMLEVN